MNINELLARAAALREETALNSISPERAGGIMYDTLIALNELWLQQGAALVISKIYASVAAMEADTAPVSDISGKPLRPGQIVVIASSDSDNGSVYRYNGTESPSWSLVGTIGNLDPVDSLDSDSATLPLAAHQGKVLDGKISQLDQNIIWTQEAYDHVVLKGDEITPTGVLENKFINKQSAELVSFNGYNVKYYAVTPGQILVCNLYSNSESSGNVASLCFYNSDNFSGQSKVLLVPYIKAPANNAYYIVIVPSGATYLAINELAEMPCNVHSALYNKDVIKSLSNAMIEVFAKLKLDYSFYSFESIVKTDYSGYYIDSGGVWVATPYFVVEEYAVTPGDVVIISNKLHAGASIMYAFYRNSGGSDVVSIGPSVISSEDSYKVIVPQDANFLCLTHFNYPSGVEKGIIVPHQVFYEETKMALDSLPTIIEYKKTGNSFVFGLPFKDKKIGVTIGPGGANELVDFRNIFVYDSDSSITSPTGVSYIIMSVGDMHGPFKFRNDGGTGDVPFTGGNHDYSGVKTAKHNYFKVFADGKLLSENASGTCVNIRFEWQNDVKPGNAYATDDPYGLRETHKMTFNGIDFEEWVDLEPLVNINMGLYYGFQLMSMIGQTNIQVPGAPNRLNYDVSDGRSSGDKYCKKVIAESNVALLSMMIDNSFDLGDRTLSDTTTRGAFMAEGTQKSYFTIVSSSSYAVNMSQGAHYWLHGWWSILPK